MKGKELSKPRLTSLYSDFRKLKELNPEGFQANVGSWRHYLLDEFLHDKVILQCGTELLNELADEELGPPLSLDVVLDSLLADGSLILAANFRRKQVKSLLSTLSWTLGLPIFNLFQAKSRVSNGSKYLRDSEYIVMSTVKRKSVPIEQQLISRICKRATRYSDLVFSKQEFCKLVGMEKDLRGWEEFDVMLTYFENYLGLIITDHSTVKVCSKREASLLSKFDSGFISEDDRNIASVKDTLVRLRKQVSNLGDRIAETKQAVIKSIQTDASRDIQRLHLRTQKMLENNLSITCKNLQNIEQLMNDIERSIDNVQLGEALSKSRDIIKNVSAQVGGVESIEKLLDEINIERLRNEEISDLLAGEFDKEDDEQLDKELEQLDSEVKDDQHVLKALSELKIDTRPVNEAAQPPSAEDAVEPKNTEKLPLMST